MKHITLSILIIAGLLLSSCSSASIGTPGSSSNNNLPTEAQLAVGTLKLAGTDQDITIEQAKELVVYWQVYKEISQSDTAAPAEIDGLIAQIQETMTDDQVEAITDMNITQQDVLTSMQEMAIVSSNSSDSTVNLPSGAASGGGMPAGGPQPDGSGIPGDTGVAAPASGTNQSQSAQTDSRLAGTTGVPSALVEAVIQALQQKIAT